ncbi:hypothetical protein [Thorsellia kenyensis]|uniref:Flagellar protein FliT n=1 Tax=Thorsellia kenyensis TaxID=1549888 RepID=A0ABV6CBQ1_9GAMM
MTEAVLNKYKSLFLLTEEMMKLCHAQEWDSLVTLETEFENLSSTLPNVADIDVEANLSPELLDLIGKTVENIQTVTELSHSKRGLLKQGIQSLDNQKKVHLAYSEFSDEAIENRLLKDIFKS